MSFLEKYERDKDPVTGMREYGTYNQPKGTWSDDSSMTIATVTSIINKSKIDYEDIMNEFINWYHYDKYTNSESGKFDIGNTTRNALINYYNGKSALESGGMRERDNGNGSLMRILPLAFIKSIDYNTFEKVSFLILKSLTIRY